MTTSLAIVLIILGQIILALFYFSRPKISVPVIKKKSSWPRNLKYSTPLFTWIIYLNLYGHNYSFLAKYSKIILALMIIVLILLRYVKTVKRREIN